MLPSPQDLLALSGIPLTGEALHVLLETLAMALGSQAYWWIRRRPSTRQPPPDLLAGANYWILVGCIFGAALGNKLVYWIEMPHQLPQALSAPWLLLGGQSMVGGLLGGLMGVEIAKVRMGVTTSTGDDFVYPILLGLTIGRVGCFLAGLSDGTYGLPCTLPWAVDFGDGQPRHPTQLYEILFAALLAALLYHLTPRLENRPGLRFRLMLSAYLLWRLGVDALKPVPYAYPFGLSGIQLVCLLALGFYLPPTWRRWRETPPAAPLPPLEEKFHP